MAIIKHKSQLVSNIIDTQNLYHSAKNLYKAMANKLDTVILATGDGDFVPLVEYLKYTEGCQVEVIAFGKSSSGQLRETVDDFTDMSDAPRNYLIGYRGGGRWMPSF